MANGHKILITEAEVERENRGMTEYEKHVERRARAIDTECWNYGDLPTVAAESAFAEARMAAYAQARATMEADRAAGYALVPVEATEAMIKAARQCANTFANSRSLSPPERVAEAAIEAGRVTEND